MWLAPDYDQRTGFDHVQAEVGDWCLETFGHTFTSNVDERCCRFLEESLEAVQALKLSKEKALALLLYVYSRPVGEPKQEAGGTIITLAALANAADIRLEDSFTDEMHRCYKNQSLIRFKNLLKTPRGEGL